MSYCEQCAKLERELAAMTKERDELKQVSGTLCPICGWAMKFPGEPCRCEIVKERDELQSKLVLAKTMTDLLHDRIGKSESECESFKISASKAMHDYETAMQELARVKAENEWHLAADQKPPYNVKVWTHGPCGDCVGAWDCNTWFAYNNDDDSFEMWTMLTPTHWREIPKGPK